MRLRLTDCSPELKRRIEDAIRNENRTSVPFANMEPAVGHEPLATSQAPVFGSPVDIHFHCIRKRLADPDGLVGKYCLDAVVRAGILEDDSAKQIRQVTFSQEQGEPEKTILTIREHG